MNHPLMIPSYTGNRVRAKLRCDSLRLRFGVGQLLGAGRRGLDRGQQRGVVTGDGGGIVWKFGEFLILVLNLSMSLRKLILTNSLILQVDSPTRNGTGGWRMTANHWPRNEVEVDR